LAQECGALLQDFFMQRRSTSGSTKWPLRDDALRTPERCFEGLPEMPGNSCYVNDLTSLMGLRMHYLTLGFRDAPIVYLCVHGIAGWSFEWRGFMSTRTSHECVIAVDLIGFGKSDKPKKASFHSVSWHVQVLLELLERLNLKDVILVQPMPQTTNQSITEDALGHALMSRASHCIAKRQCVVLSALSDPVLEAPFPDAGHRAAQRTFKT
jgi:tRNA(adenine34) deaminase